MREFRPVKAYVDVSALHHNLNQVRQMAPQSKVLAMVKANGYGHGLLRVANQLSAADGFGVASLDEAIVLRQQGFLHPIVLLEGVFSEAEWSWVQQLRLDCVIHSAYQLQGLLKQTIGSPINIWIKIDTGMHRLGFLPSDVAEVLATLQPLASKVNVHLMSHFSSADEPNSHVTQAQFDCFMDLVGSQDYPKSLANSAAIFHFPETHLDWVRPGIMLYGAGGFDTQLTQHGLKPVMHLVSKLCALKWLAPGEKVGYSGTWQAERKSLIGVVAIGYGDGYPRHAPSGTPVWIANQKVPLVGRVSMDMICVDLTDLAEQVSVGEPVQLWGDKLSVDEVAAWAGTISYELLCGVTARVPFVEINTDEEKGDTIG